MLLMLGLNQTLSISISLIPKNSEKRILLCSAMVKTREHELATLLKLIFLIRTSV